MRQNRIGDLARYLMVSRQNLSGLISRMERDGHVAVAPDGRDRRSRVVTMTPSGLPCLAGARTAQDQRRYEQILGDFSINDVTHTPHYLLKMLENMQRLDAVWAGAGEAEGGDEAAS
jgi:DNA-binding MarR family transcriptional regulator